MSRTATPCPAASHRRMMDSLVTRIRAWALGSARSGSFLVWWALGAFFLAIALGLVVDGGGKVHAKQHANLVAEEAARTGGQQVIRPLGMRGIAAVSDPALAQAAAQAYLALQPDVHGVVIPTGPTSITVTTTVIYQPKILGLIGVGPQPVTGHAVITLNRTNNGTGGIP